jgi:hypothetical protein
LSKCGPNFDLKKHHDQNEQGPYRIGDDRMTVMDCARRGRRKKEQEGKKISSPLYAKKKNLLKIATKKDDRMSCNEQYHNIKEKGKGNTVANPSFRKISDHHSIVTRFPNH